MGLYDTLVEGDKQAQVKCFSSEMNTYEVGDRVPYDGSLIIMFPPYEGARYAIVKDSIFLGFTDSAPALIDKWREHLISYDDFKDPYNELAQKILLRDDLDQELINEDKK